MGHGCMFCTVGGGGPLIEAAAVVSLCSSVAGLAISPLVSIMMYTKGRRTYPAHDRAASSTLANFISGTLPYFAARKATRRYIVAVRMPNGKALLEAVRQLYVVGLVLPRASQRMANELLSVFEEIGAELAARSREIMQRVQVEMCSKTRHNTARVSSS